VVVPWASLIGQLGFEWSSVVARRKAEGYGGELVLHFRSLSRFIVTRPNVPVLLGVRRTLVIVRVWVRRARGILLGSSLHFRMTAECIGLLMCPFYWEIPEGRVMSVEKI